MSVDSGATIGTRAGSSARMQREDPSDRTPRKRRQKRRDAGPLGPARPPSDRPAQIAGEIRRALQSELARGLNDPRVQGMVSITEVVLAPDMSVARVRVSVVPADRASLTLSGLRAGAGFLRRRLMDETRIARVPRLEFEVDERLKRQAALDAAIRTGEDPKDQGPSGSESMDSGVDAAADRASENPRDEG
mgnify:CR=1 FL=1